MTRRRPARLMRTRHAPGATPIAFYGLLVCFCCVDAASFTSVKSGLWSDPATWKTTRGLIDGDAPKLLLLPGPGDDVVIAPGTTVILDATSSSSGLAAAADAALNSVRVQSQAVLTCPRNNNNNNDNNNNNADASATTAHLELGLSVATFRIESGGCFSCGYGDCKAQEAEPFAGRFVLRLTSPLPPASETADVRTFMVESGGALFLSGVPRVRSIARLAADVGAGQATLRLADSVGAGGAGVNSQPWRVGDRVAIGPTDLIPGQTEYRTIVGIEPSTGGSAGSTTILTLSDPLKYAHAGRVVSLVNKADNNRQVTIDTRAEVALLSRNIVIEGTNDAVTGLGGDLMIAGDNVRARLSWVELRYLGRRGHLARYPLHIHNLGDGGRNVFVSNVAIHSSFQRGVVIHCTNGVTLVNNTVAGSPGFAYMLEDGAEENNVLINNYALDVKPADYPLIQTERVNSAGFWFVNAANSFVGNVAAGVAGVGFSLDMDPVLSARPATLSTCPERLPGYNATLARTNAAEFNRAVNTALVKKNFVRFQDNVAHSAHSGLWLSYPFTPMFFVERPTPIVRFTAWNIASRQMPPSSLESSDGVSLQFDGCIRLQGQRGMHIYQPTCVNSDSATWASCVNTFDGLTVGWVGDALQSKPPPPPTTNKANGAMIAHLEPQVFLRTQVFSGGDNNNTSTSPLFASISKGGPLAALNALNGLTIDNPSSSSSSASSAPPPLPSTNRPLIQLNAGDMHVFTDVNGDAFGAGPGAAVAATPFNASGVDPVIEIYAPGQCTTGSYPAKRSWRDVTSSLLPNGRVIAVTGGLPMLCRGGDANVVVQPVTKPLRFTGLSMGLVRRSDWTRARAVLEVDIGDIGARWLRRTRAFPVMLPLNDASMNPSTGGYSLRLINDVVPAQPSPDDVILELALTPTIQPSDGMTFVISGLPSGARVSKQQPGGVQPLVEYGTSLACRRQIASPACTAAAKRTLNRPVVCVCMVTDTPGGEMMIARIQAGLTPRNIGLATDKGSMLGVYDFPVLRVDL